LPNPRRDARAADVNLAVDDFARRRHHQEYPKSSERPGSGYSTCEQTPLLLLPDSQHPELHQAEGEETVPDSACPPRLFTHCLHPITSAKLGNFLARSAQPQERPLPLSQSEKGSAAAARGVVVVASSGHQGLRPRPCPHRCAAFLGLKIHSASATDCRLAPTSAKAKEGPRNPP
jgi:hypothetical protein